MKQKDSTALLDEIKQTHRAIRSNKEEIKTIQVNTKFLQKNLDALMEGQQRLGDG